MSSIGQYQNHINDFRMYNGMNNRGNSASRNNSTEAAMVMPKTISPKTISITKEPNNQSTSDHSFPPGVKGRLVPADQRIEQLQQSYDDKELKKLGVVECSTCANRTYQDDSQDGSVSFQSPTRISPSEAPAAVRGHEMEHVSHEQLNAEKEDREVVSQTVQIHSSICPECGRSYVSGGLTTTTTRNKQSTSQDKNQVGNLMDITF